MIKRLISLFTLLRRLLLLTVLACIAACSADDDTNVTYVVVTSTPDVPTFTPFPTLTPMPTATPTPDIPPDIGLRLGERYMLDGYYEQAITTFQGVLSRGDAAPELRAAAAFGQGQAALREGLFSQAVTAFTYVIDNFPGEVRAQQAYFLRGDAYLGLSRWTEAINDFRQYLRQRPGLIDSYAHERIGDAFLAINMPADALTSYQQATSQSRSLTPALALREKVARVYTSSGDIANAIAQYDAILAVARNAPYRSDIELRAAQAVLGTGDLENGLARMQTIFNNYPEQPAALEALHALEANGRTVSALQRGRVLYNRGDYQGAIQAFNDFTNTAALTDIPAELYLLLGRAYREVGNPPAALIAFRTIIEQYPTDPLFGDALLEQGRTRFLAGDIPDAITFYLRIAQDYTSLPATAAEALWRAGYLYGTTQQYAESRRVFMELATRYPQSEQARSGLSIAAVAASSQGDNASAEQLFRQLATTSAGATQAEAWLQVGRLALNRSDSATADAAFREAVSAAPDTYFSARAADILAGRAPFTPPAVYRFEFDEEAQLQEAEAWLRQTFAISQDGALWPLSDALRSDPRIVRGTELWVMGAFQAAETEFYEVLEANRSNALASYQLALYFRGLGSYTPSQVGAANIITTAGIATTAAPSFIARLRYPVYYLDVLLEVANQRGLDPLLLFSLIRHESLFNPNATAAASEKGLTQVIPDTAAYIANQLNWPNYQNTDLFKPYVSIAFGSYYLDEQLRRFNGDVYAGLSAYNAGPGRAMQWRELAGSDPDLFMSTITIESTRLYIQLIYRNYSIYRALYGSDA